MKMLISFLFVGVVSSLVACSSDGSDGGTGGGSNGNGSGTSSSSSSSCTKEFQCINGSCKCTNEGPKKGSSCCDPDDSSCASSSSNCDTYCKNCK